MDKTIANLIDELSIVNIKIFFLIEVQQNESDNDKVAEAARKTILLNKQRSKLMNEIDKILQGKENIIKI